MINELRLTDAERTAMRMAVMGVPHNYGDEDFHQFVYHCWRSGGTMPARLTQALFDFRMGRGGSALLIKGLPLAQRALPPTPSKRSVTWNDASLFARKLMCVALSQIGHIYNFSKKKDFDYIDDVFPIYVDRNEQLGTNRTFLEWHVEDGFHPAKADLAALFCLRGDEAAQTYLCEATDLQLAPHFREELLKPNFLISVDPTFQSVQTGDQQQYRCAVLSDGKDPEIVYDPAYMRGVTPFAQAALEHVRTCIDSVYQTVTLEAGDMLLFDNRRVMHARSAYEPSYDGNDRWLLRALLLESYWKARECMSELAFSSSPLSSSARVAHIAGKDESSAMETMPPRSLDHIMRGENGRQDEAANQGEVA